MAEGKEAAMTYKVFFVEDEIVTREGIRDRVDWRGHGFEFCGEAPDGEIALPLLQTLRPDVLITDIKMPFMDGLALARIVHERMPATKIIILSGHDEFEYAQKAIKLGVTEYLLKPITIQDLHQTLRQVAAELDSERRAQEQMERLRREVEDTRAGLRQRLLLDLVVGAVSSAQAIEQAEQLDIDLLARSYLVVVVKIALNDPAAQFDYSRFSRACNAVSCLVERDPDTLLTKKDLEEIVLILKGETDEALFEKAMGLRGLIEQQMQTMGCHPAFGSGAPKRRITDICASFVEALASLQSADSHNGNGTGNGFAKVELLKINKSAVATFLKCGIAEDLDEFFDTFIRPLGAAILDSAIVRHYILMDVVLTTAKFLSELGGNIDQVIPDLDLIEDTQTADQIRQQVQSILLAALAFRDSQVTSQHAAMIQQAISYIDSHFADTNLSLPAVAGRAHLSPSHFCAVFSQETGKTFKEYLTEIRMQRARELLRGTALKSFEIADQIGYNDPHYFSYVFRKHTGQSPMEYRWQAHGAS
jgi:two-component system response regulator YesN